MLSGRDQCDGPIAGPEDSYRVRRVLSECDLETSTRRGHVFTRAVESLEGDTKLLTLLAENQSA